jgi:site-specific recombinase XerD
LIVSIPGKEGLKPDIPYWEPAEVKLLLEQPNQDQVLRLRDHVLIQFLYNTGVRVSEALSLSVGALELGAARQVRVRGKGPSDRVCPLWRKHDGASETLHRQLEARGGVTAVLRWTPAPAHDFGSCLHSRNAL